MDLPVMPPFRPMLAKSIKGVPAADSVEGGLSYEPGRSHRLTTTERGVDLLTLDQTQERGLP